VLLYLSLVPTVGGTALGCQPCAARMACRAVTWAAPCPRHPSFQLYSNSTARCRWWQLALFGDRNLCVLHSTPLTQSNSVPLPCHVWPAQRVKASLIVHCSLRRTLNLTHSSPPLSNTCACLVMRARTRFVMLTPPTQAAVPRSSSTWGAVPSRARHANRHPERELLSTGWLRAGAAVRNAEACRGTVWLAAATAGGGAEKHKQACLVVSSSTGCLSQNRRTWGGMQTRAGASAQYDHRTGDRAGILAACSTALLPALPACPWCFPQRWLAMCRLHAPQPGWGQQQRRDASG